MPLLLPQVEMALNKLVAIVQPRLNKAETEDPTDVEGSTEWELRQAKIIDRQLQWWRDSTAVLSELCHPAVQIRHRWVWIERSHLCVAVSVTVTTPRSSSKKDLGRSRSSSLVSTPSGGDPAHSRLVSSPADAGSSRGFPRA